MKQAKYILRFFFDAGSGVCLWSGNEVTNSKYGYAIAFADLPLSESAIKEGEELVQLYDNSIDWEYPVNPSVWATEEKNNFTIRVEQFINLLQKELGSSFFVQNRYQDY